MASRCDIRCTNATGKSCDCECGGANHGGYTTAIDHTSRSHPGGLEDGEIQDELRYMEKRSEFLTGELRRNDPSAPNGKTAREMEKELASMDKRYDALEKETDKRSGKDKVKAARAEMSEKVLKSGDVQKLEDEFYDLKGVIEDDTQSVKSHREAADKMHGLRFRIVEAYNERYDSKETYERISRLTSESAQLIEEEGI